MEKLFTIQETAEYFSVSKATIFKWLREGLLKSTKIGGSTRITETAINEFVQKKLKED